MSFEMRGSTPKCTIHFAKICPRYCKKCNTPICALCDSLGQHKLHETEHISKMADGIIEPLKKGVKSSRKVHFSKTLNCKVMQQTMLLYFSDCFWFCCVLLWVFVLLLGTWCVDWITQFCLYLFWRLVHSNQLRIMHCLHLCFIRFLRII